MLSTIHLHVFSWKFWTLLFHFWHWVEWTGGCGACTSNRPCKLPRVQMKRKERTESTFHKSSSSSFLWEKIMCWWFLQAIRGCCVDFWPICAILLSHSWRNRLVWPVWVELCMLCIWCCIYTLYNNITIHLRVERIDPLFLGFFWKITIWVFYN